MTLESADRGLTEEAGVDRAPSPAGR